MRPEVEKETAAAKRADRVQEIDKRIAAWAERV